MGQSFINKDVAKMASEIFIRDFISKIIIRRKENDHL